MHTLLAGTRTLDNGVPRVHNPQSLDAPMASAGFKDPQSGLELLSSVLARSSDALVTSSDARSY